MLVLQQYPDEEIYIGNEIVITVVQVKGGKVKLGITAPRDLKILRSSLKNKENTDDRVHQEHFTC